jgi:hypothetical protein
VKDVDETPVLDQKIYRVDSFSENVQKPYEHPSGEWSQTGASSAAYATMNKNDQPYVPKEGEKQGSDAGGRKPERR